MAKTPKYDSFLGMIREDDVASIQALTNLHVNGEPEYAGNTSYAAQSTSGARGVGAYFTATELTYVKYVEIRAWAANANSTCQVRIYRGYDSTTTVVISSLTLLKTINFGTAQFPTSTTGYVGFELDDEILLAPTESIFVFIQPLTLNAVNIAQWNVIGSPARQLIVLTTNTDVWNNPWLVGSAPYYAIPLKVYRKTDFTPSRFSPDITLPLNIYVAEGRECNLWKDAVALPGSVLDFSCSKGKALERGFRYTGLNADIGTTTPITVTSSDANSRLIQNQVVNLKPVAKNNGTGSKQILVIGDSLIAGSETVTELRSLITTDGGITPLMLGTKGTNPNRHEGISGAGFDTFTTSGSPFYIGGRIDMKAYLTANSNFGGTNNIDFAIIQLGINHLLTGVKTQADVDAVITLAKTLINGILDSTYGFPACKIILAMPPTGGNTSNGFAENYGATTQRQQYEANMRLFNQSLITAFDNAAFSFQVTLCSSGLWVDRTNGYTLADVAISSRVATTEKRHTNAVHPNTSGYQQIADGMYSTLRFLVS